MSNPDPNHENRFKPGEPPPSSRPGANKPYSVRNAIRLAAARLNADGKAKAQVIGEKLVEMAEQGDIRAVEVVIEQIDGKVPQTNINAQFAEIQGMSDEQLADFIQRNAGIALQSSSGDSGTETPENGTSVDAEGGSGDKQADNTAGV